MEKIKILDHTPNPSDPAGHLRPVIDFLIKQGNIPHKKSLEFSWDKTGVGELHFYGPIDTEALKERFQFPETIKVDYSPYLGDGVIWDKGNALVIKRSRT